MKRLTPFPRLKADAVAWTRYARHCPLLIALLFLCLGSTECSSQTRQLASDSAVGLTEPDSGLQLIRSAKLPVSAMCAADEQHSTGVNFSEVRLGRIQTEVERQERVLTGKAGTRVVLDSVEWPAVWRALVDTVPPPRISFGSDAILIAATQTYGQGPTNLRIVAIRKCDSGVIVVASKDVSTHRGEDFPSRGLAVARIRRDIVQGSQVVFVTIPN
jgi:hypothetical protein